MKKLFVCLCMAVSLAACTNDDQYSWEEDFADRTTTDTIDISIVFNGSSATVSGDCYGYVSVTDADVVVRSNTNKFLQLSLSGSTDNGSLLIYSWKRLGLLLHGVSITNPDGPAINNQCGKDLVVSTVAGTVNTLSDGKQYADAPTNALDASIDQKGAFFSEGQIYFRGAGTLNVNGHARNGIASDDYIVVESGTIHVQVDENGNHGIKVNDGFTIRGGTLTVDVKADGARGIKNDARTLIAGGQTTISTSGNCRIDTTFLSADNFTIDTTSCAGIKSDSLFLMTAGMLTITSTGDGGKGVNCSDTILVQGGTLVATTTGSNDVGKPKAVKSEKAIVLSGGSFYASCLKSWACDNGSEDDDPERRVDVIGEPIKEIYSKRLVNVVF